MEAVLPEVQQPRWPGSAADELPGGAAQITSAPNNSAAHKLAGTLGAPSLTRARSWPEAELLFPGGETGIRDSPGFWPS
jgi:hypothetical protein